jgi:hypothetical protein
MIKRDIRKAEHKAYQQVIDAQIQKYEALRRKQKPLASQSLQHYFTEAASKMPMVKPFLPFANAVVTSLRNDYTDKILKLDKELKEMERERVKLRVEFDSTMKLVDKSFAAREDKVGEGNPIHLSKMMFAPQRMQSSTDICHFLQR